MKKIIILLIIIFAAYLFFSIRSAPKLGTVQAAVIAETNTQYASSPTFIPTSTPAPSPTIGYEATLMIAQATADEARRINAQVTVAHEQNLLAQMQLTADTEYRSFQVQSWTAAAGPTIIPLTATAQVIANTQIANGQQIVSAGYTQQAAAPTQMAAIIQLQSTAKFAQANEIMKLVAMGLLIAFLLAGIALFVRLPIEREEEQEPQAETVVQLRRDNGQGSFTLQRTVIPCSPNQLTELAQKITTGKKTLAINNWEGADTLFTRPIIQSVRSWMQMQTPKFAVPTGDGQLVPTEDGFSFFAAWLENQKLPGEYEFTEMEQPEEPEKNTGDGFVPLGKDDNGYHFEIEQERI